MYISQNTIQLNVYTIWLNCNCKGIQNTKGNNFVIEWNKIYLYVIKKFCKQDFIYFIYTILVIEA